jgi:glycosyltransferase involved in cell wall biosynthesis
MRVALLAHSLDVGGSERQLTTLAVGLRRKGHDVVTFVLKGGGALEHELHEGEVPVEAVDSVRPWYGRRALRGLLLSLRAWEPDIVHSYLVVPNILLATLRPALRRARLVWGVRASEADANYAMSRAAFALTKALARVPDLVIANSEAARRFHLEQGYPAHTMTVIENGIDTDRYRRDAAGASRLRADWGIPASARLVGMVARLDPVKNHPSFVRAAGEVARTDRATRFVCVGPAPGPQRAALERLAGEVGLGDRFVWINERKNLAEVYSALDVCCLASRSEGFPNVVAEAMACCTPCVVADVGDAAAIVDGTGVVVARNCPAALATGLQELLSLPGEERRALGDAARQRIVTRYSAHSLVERTERALQGLL